MTTVDDRLKRLERLLVDGQTLDTQSPVDVVQLLARAQQQFDKLLADRAKIAKFFERLPEIETYLQQPFLEGDDSIPVDVKADLALAYEPDLTELAEHLDGVDKLKDTLDSQHVKDVDNRYPKLTELTFKFQLLECQAQNVDEQCLQLVADYNAKLMCVQQMLVDYDQYLSSLEEQAFGNDSTAQS